MKIADLIVTPVAIPLAAPLLHAWGVHPGFGRVIIQVVTDDGQIGLGETSLTPHGRQMEEVLRACKPLIRGEDPFDLERLRWKVSNPFYVRMFGPNLTNAYAAIEFACLDIQGQAIGRPVYDLLGGRMRERVPISAYIFYESSHGAEATPPWEEADARIVEKCVELVEGKGCLAIKFKGGVYPPDEEAATVRHLRERFPDVPIRLDPNSSWALTTAVRIARALVDYNLEYLEDPVWGLQSMAKLKRLAPWMPLASNMACFGYEDVAPAVLLDAVDVVLADPHWYGGLRATKELARLCETFGLDMGMHSGTEFGVSLAAVLHLAAALPSIHHAPDAHYHYLSDDVIEGGPLGYGEGAIGVPEGPGLGVKLDANKLAHYNQVYEWYAAAAAEGAPKEEPVYSKARW
jgi:glucarate dehydratase